MCSELVLEHTHQQFKKWLVSSTHPDVHIRAIEKALARDWLWRLSSLEGEMYTGDSKTQRRVETGLRRILLGEDGLMVDNRSGSGTELIRDMKRKLGDAMEPPLPSLMKNFL